MTGPQLPGPHVLPGPSSKFRHAQGTVLHRDTHITNLKGLSLTTPGESDGFCANPQRVAVPLVGSGGQVAVLEVRALDPHSLGSPECSKPRAPTPDMACMSLQGCIFILVLQMGPPRGTTEAQWLVTAMSVGTLGTAGLRPDLPPHCPLHCRGSHIWCLEATAQGWDPTKGLCLLSPASQN